MPILEERSDAGWQFLTLSYLRLPKRTLMVSRWATSSLHRHSVTMLVWQWFGPTPAGSAVRTISGVIFADEQLVRPHKPLPRLECVETRVSQSRICKEPAGPDDAGKRWDGVGLIFFPHHNSVSFPSWKPIWCDRRTAKGTQPVCQTTLLFWEAL